jgi:Zn-dependent protease/CBS domain-containing protein
MSWSVKLFTLGGTAVRMHLTFLLLIAWIAAAQYMRGSAQDAVYGVMFILVLFACVVLHEFGHIFAARRYGIRTPDVTLLPIGGVASMERMPEKPGQEIVVALAGPAVNAVIALVLIGLLGLRLDTAQVTVEALQENFWVQVAVANVILLVFNLIPAFPMDGGRVLRALLAMWLGFGPATKVAARIGQGLAIVFAFLGLMGNPLLILIAVFIFLAAAGEAGYVQVRELTRGRLVTDAMITKFEALGVMSTVDDAAALLLRTTQQEFPVLDGAERLRGFVTRKAIIDSLAQENGGAQPVLEVMAGDVPVVPLQSYLETAVRLVQESSARCVGVVDDNGSLAGYVTPENISELMMIRSSRDKSHAGFARG